ncbi:MAG: C4-type zinc ribbon domain-containing protein [Terriglobia bacterium]
MLPDIQLAIRLQTLDDRTAALSKEIATLPKHIAEIEKKLETHQRRLDADRAAFVANQKERKRLEDDIQSQDQKISKLKNQMLEAKNNEQYHAFQKEIDFCQQEIKRFEDLIIDLMTESEALDTNVKSADVALAAERKEVEAQKKTAQERTATHRKELGTLQQERTGIVPQMTPKVASEYERIRKGRAGVAIAEMIDGRCSKCNITLRPQFIQELKRGDSIMICESCRRMLYYNPPQRFDELVPESVRQSGAQ